MARSRLLDNKPQYRLASGALAAGGAKIYFYETGTTTPKDVYNAPSGGTNLGSEITLDDDGRHSEDIWLDDDVAYRIDVRDSDGASIPGYPLDDVGGPGGSGAALIDPADGGEDQVYRADGLGGGAWDDVNEVPDSTGHATTEILYSDGAGGSEWGAPPEIPEYDNENLPGSITEPSADALTVAKKLFQMGSDFAATNGTIRVSDSVVFPIAFTGTPRVFIAPTIGGVTGDTPSAGVSHQVVARSTTGFTVEFFAGAEANSPDTDITSAVTYDWFAIGPYDPA